MIHVHVVAEVLDMTIGLIQIYIQTVVLLINAIVSSHSPRKRMFVNQHPAPNASLSEQIKHVHERQEIPSRRVQKHDTHRNGNNNK